MIVTFECLCFAKYCIIYHITDNHHGHTTHETPDLQINIEYEFVLKIDNFDFS